MAAVWFLDRSNGLKECRIYRHRLGFTNVIVKSLPQAYSGVHSAWLLSAALCLATCTCFEPRVETVNSEVDLSGDSARNSSLEKKFRNTSVWAVKVLEVVCRRPFRRKLSYTCQWVESSTPDVECRAVNVTGGWVFGTGRLGSLR